MINHIEKITNLKPLQYGSVVYDYVTNTRRIKNTEDIYEALYYITPTWKVPYGVF